MFDLKLFLGFTPDTAFENELKKCNTHLIGLLIDQEDYLQKIEYKNQTYLGKLIAAKPTVAQLEDLEIHLLSLLQKLTPNYNFSQNPPQVITLNAE
ncbi:MAG: hypothetical protein S4CHLAM123_08870 [Chlamydiales bacterium]|nr:hypothetical protein [Chlamydiales bacterium]